MDLFNSSKVAPPLPKRSRRLRILSLEVTLSLPLRRRLNQIDPRRWRQFARINTSLEAGNNNNQTEEPRTSDSDFDRDSLEQPNLESPIREGSPPISQVVPYPPDIQETPTQVQAPLGTPLVGLPFLNLHNFREFDLNTRTVQLFPLDHMATGNPTQNFLSVVTSVADMAGSSAAAQQLMTMAAQQPGPSTSIPVGGMAQQPLYTQTTSNLFLYGMPSITMGSVGNFFANNMVPSMPMSSGVPPSNFVPSQFGNAHIPLSNPTLGSSFAQTRAQVESNPMLGGGFIRQSYAHYRNAAATRINFIPQIGSPFGNPSILGGKMFGKKKRKKRT